MNRMIRIKRDLGPKIKPIGTQITQITQIFNGFSYGFNG